MVGDVISISKIYKENLTVSEFIEAQSQRSSFVQIGLPCILGLSYTFNQPDNPINPDGVKWVLLENLLKNIATLHFSRDNFKLIDLTIEQNSYQNLL